jgi:hypothetical protein
MTLITLKIISVISDICLISVIINREAIHKNDHRNRRDQHKISDQKNNRGAISIFITHNSLAEGKLSIFSKISVCLYEPPHLCVRYFLLREAK